MRNWGLRSRLFVSHMLVMLVSLGCYMTINRYASFRFFGDHLESLVFEQSEILPLRDLLLDGFAFAWHAGAAWSILTGTFAALLLSFWVAQRITIPLVRMEQTTQKFAAGHLDLRIPASSVPEINRLSRSFNRMALSLERVEQKRREMIGDLAHEFRTPLTIIRGYLEELSEERVALNVSNFAPILREVRRLERLVQDLQVLSKAEAGHLPLKLQSISLLPLLHHVQETLSSQICEGGPTLEIKCPKTIPPVWADRDRTEQILVNLVGNAIQYTEQGRITIQVEADPSWVWITIIDTGSGINSEDLPHVFERFWRSQPSRSQYKSGSGLGLSITQRLVELQGGQISVESQLNQGSQFKFSLPTTEPSKTTHP